MVAKFWTIRLRPDRHRRRAVVAVQVGVMLAVLLGVAALTIDVGQLYATRGELQRAADAASLAGASALTTDEMMQVRLGTADTDGLASVVDDAVTRANQFSNLNPTLNEATQIETGDVLTGWINLNSASEKIQTNPDPNDYNAVQVIVHRNAEGSNGQIPLFFSGVFGRYYAESAALAVAAFDDRFAGFDASVPGGNIIPMSVSRDAYMQDYLNGADTYSYDESTNTVFNAADGIREVRIYPYPLSGSGYEGGDGNFGFLNIGTGNQGVEAERDQIINGVSAEDFEMEIGTSDLNFYDGSGSNTYDITGSPGLESTLQDTFEPMIGQVIGFFLHDGFADSGSNTTYTISELRFGRIMDVRLIGNPALRGIYVQPISYVGNGVRTSPDAPSTNGQIGRIVLVR